MKKFCTLTNVDNF